MSTLTTSPPPPRPVRGSVAFIFLVPFRKSAKFVKVSHHLPNRFSPTNDVECSKSKRVEYVKVCLKRVRERES